MIHEIRDLLNRADNEDSAEIAQSFRAAAGILMSDFDITEEMI